MGIKILSLSRNEDFKKILTGRKVNNYYSTIFYKRVSSKHDNVLNLSIITKRKLGKAVQRNKIKRRLKNIVNYIKKNNEADYIESLLSSSDQEVESVDIQSSDDPLYNEAVTIVLETRKSSISFLQRKLRIGYNRAANLIDTMESKGLLSAPQPNGTREILTSEKT